MFRYEYRSVRSYYLLVKNLRKLRSCSEYFGKILIQKRYLQAPGLFYNIINEYVTPIDDRVDHLVWCPVGIKMIL